ncbi:hypothetical protein Taro_043985, partial [Colocasia esculenta]|nr:hypothetical protein [Colocasia esculenta]
MFDIPISLWDFVMKDLDQKWRSWKYDLRTKFLMPYQKAQQHFAYSDIGAVEEQWKKLVHIWSSEEFKDSLARRRVGILNFPRQVVASGILMSDDNDNVVMGKKLGGEYYEVSILIAHD